MMYLKQLISAEATLKVSTVNLFEAQLKHGIIIKRMQKNNHTAKMSHEK